ncbi:hypothetical protein C8R42DRAFT_741101 [Lentinula raphanica]|nr:hypothetical protein C8R42DRAFT_741101 [Lentinula raphanica]
MNNVRSAEEETSARIPPTEEDKNTLKDPSPDASLTAPTCTPPDAAEIFVDTSSSLETVIGRADRQPSPAIVRTTNARLDITQYFDLEAQVDSDADAYESEDEESDGFIDDQETTRSRSSSPHVPMQSDPDSAFLDHLVETYGPREPPVALPSDEPSSALSQTDKIRLNNFDDRTEEKLIRKVHLRVDDWQLYRLKCLPNTEWDVVRYLLTAKDLRSELRAVFHNYDKAGVIYLEARFLRNTHLMKPVLLDTLRILADVRLSSLRVVPDDEYGACLTTNLSPQYFYSIGDWVTVSHGLYKNDVGLVLGHAEAMGAGNHNFGVLLVPRIAMKFDADRDEYEQSRSSRKRKRALARPPPVLFTLEKCGPRPQEFVTKISSDKAVTEHDYQHKVLGTFSHGLILKYFTSQSLRTATVIPPVLIHLFIKSKHPIFQTAPLLLPDTWEFLPGDRVVSISHGLGRAVSGIVKTVAEKGCEIETDDGFHHVPMLQLRKVFTPGDYVKVLQGPKTGSTWLVAAVTSRLIGLIPDYGKAITCWLDANTVTSTDSSRLVQVDFPWKNVEVRITRGLFSNRKAIVKNVCPDGHGSLRLLIYIPSIYHSLEVDYTEVVECSSQRSLTTFAPIPEHLSQFRPNRDLEAMKTGKKPWIGARVKIVKGPWKGYRGVVRDVDVYKLNAQQLARKASGVRLVVELEVVTPTVTHPRHPIDYDHVREASSNRSLALAIRPNEHQSFFMPCSSYMPSKPVPETGHPVEFQTRSRTPEPDEFARSFILTGRWHPRWDTGDILPAEENFQPPPDYFQENGQDSVHVLSLPNIRDTLWIFHSKLVGIPIQVDLKGRKGTHYVKVMPRQDGGGFMVTEDKLKGGEPTVVWTSDVSRTKDRPKPKTEKSLMVIVKGPEENIGKLVRRVHHFYKGSQRDENLWFILGVVQFLSETGESLTSERIDGHPDDLEKVQESRDIHRKSGFVMAAARDEFRFQRPEILSQILDQYVRNDIKLRPTGRRFCVEESPFAGSLEASVDLPTHGHHPTPVDDSDASGTESDTNAATTTTTTAKKNKRGRESPLTEQQQAVVHSKYPGWEKILRKKKLHLGKLDKDGARGKDPSEITDWLNTAVKEIKASPVFSAVHDTQNKIDRTILDMFRNHRHNTFIKKNQHDVVQEAIAKLRKSKTIKDMEALKAAESLVSFKAPSSAKEIFRKQNEQQIQEEALKMRASAAQAREEAGIDPQDVDKRKSDNGGGFYQRALTELWKNADHALYEKMAADEHNIFENQKEFPAAMKTSLMALSEGGRVGPMEIFMLYGFRNEQNIVKHGRLNVHYISPENGLPPPNFLCSEKNDARADNLVEWWSKYCQIHLPKHRASVEEAQPTNDPTYIEYKNGIPVLVRLQLEECSLSFVRNVLKEYICKLWHFSWPKDREYPSVPLAEIHANADDYYDTVKYPFHVSLAEIETLKHSDLLVLAEHLLRISAPSSPEPFVFRQKAEIQKRINLRLEQKELDRTAGQEIDVFDVPLPVIANIQSAPSQPSHSPMLLDPSVSPSNGALNIPSAISNDIPPVVPNATSQALPSGTPSPISTHTSPSPLIPNDAFPAIPNNASSSISNKSFPVLSNDAPPDILNNAALAITSPSSAVENMPPSSNAPRFPSPGAPNVLPVPDVPSTSVATPVAVPPIVAAVPSPAMPNVFTSSTISHPIMAAAPSPTIVSTPLSTGPSEPVRAARKTRANARKNQTSSSRTDPTLVAGVSTTSADEVDTVRRSSRTKSRKRTNPDSGPQPAAKKAKQHSKGWSDLVPQTDGRVMMVNDKGVSEGYVTQNADGDPILVDENDIFF